MSFAGLRSSFWKNKGGGFDPTAFVFTVDTTIIGATASDQFQLPLQNLGTQDFTIYWGDGSSDYITAYDDTAKTHTYPSGGVYTAQLIGFCNGWSFRGTGDKNKITEVSQWGTSIEYWDTFNSQNNGHFRGCENITITAIDTPIWASNRSCEGFFYQATNLSGSGVNKIGLNGQTSLRYFFSGTNYNEPLDEWDVSTIQLMIGTFSNMGSFTQNLSMWNTISLISIQNLAAGGLFNGDISGWNTINLEIAANAFNTNGAFNRNIGLWTVSSLTTASQMLFRAYAFDQDLGNWEPINCSNFINFLYQVTISTSNYDSLLIGWSALNLLDGISFHGGNSQYTSAGETAKNSIITNDSWSFIDGGLAA